MLAIDIDQSPLTTYTKSYLLIKEQIIYGDFLNRIFEISTQNRFRSSGNLPYNISSQIFFRILENRDLIPQVVCMIQKEVAERISASHGNKIYWNFKRIPANILRHRVPFHRGRTGFRSTTKSKIRRNPTHPE